MMKYVFVLMLLMFGRWRAASRPNVRLPLDEQHDRHPAGDAGGARLLDAPG